MNMSENMNTAVAEFRHDRLLLVGRRRGPRPNERRQENQPQGGNIWISTTERPILRSFALRKVTSRAATRQEKHKSHS